MRAGEIALAQLQQADGRLKARPILILGEMPPFSDFLVGALSSKLQHECAGFDEIVDRDDDDFLESGLKVSSLIRLGMVATLPGSAMLGRLGTISNERLNRLRRCLARHIDAGLEGMSFPIHPIGRGLGIRHQNGEAETGHHGDGGAQYGFFHSALRNIYQSWAALAICFPTRRRKASEKWQAIHEGLSGEPKPIPESQQIKRQDITKLYYPQYQTLPPAVIRIPVPNFKHWWPGEISQSSPHGPSPAL